MGPDGSHVVLLLLSVPDQDEWYAAVDPGPGGVDLFIARSYSWMNWSGSCCSRSGESVARF